MPRGKKICPDCDTELGVRTSTCPECDHVFAKKTPKKKTPVIVEPEVEEIEEEIEDEIIPEEEPAEVEEEKVIPRKRLKTINYKGDELSIDSVLACFNPIKTYKHAGLITCIAPVVVKKDLEPEIQFNNMYPKVELDTTTGNIAIYRGKPEDIVPNIIVKNVIIKE